MSSESVSAVPPPAASRWSIPLGLRGRFLLSLVGASVATWMAYTRFAGSAKGGSSSGGERALFAFWFEDLPPLTGVARIYLYGGLLLTAWFSHFARPHLGDSPLQAPELYAYTLPRFFSLEGAMQLLHSPRWINHTMMHLLRTVTLASFLCCIAGLGGVIPPVIVGVGMLLLHGIVQGCIGTSHRWYVPVYTCLALAFANGNAELSLDSWLYARYGSAYPFPPVCTLHPSSLLCSGFARKMVLMFGMSTLFFGAITKILNGGWAWLDGRSLSYYVSSEENGRSRTLKQLMHRYRSISLLLSIGSIGLEAVSIVAVFVPWTRLPIIVSAAGLHLGIWLTMWPNYFPQTLCYAIGMKWSWIEPATSAASFPLSSPSLHLAAWCGVWLWAFLCLVALLRIEYWPLTGIPMYSFYRDTSYSYRHLRDEWQAQGVALEHAASGYPNALAWSNLWVNLRLKNVDPEVRAQREARKAAAEQQSQSAVSRADRPSADSRSLASSEREFVNLKTRVTESRYTRASGRGVYLKQWRRTLHNIAAHDMASKEWGRVEARDESFPAQRWLRSMLPHLRRYARVGQWRLPDWVDRSGELQLRVRLLNRYAILAAVPWNPQLDADGHEWDEGAEEDESPKSVEGLEYEIGNPRSKQE